MLPLDILQNYSILWYWQSCSSCNRWS